MQVKLNISLLEDISDDIDFCFKLAKEESVIILPGTIVQINGFFWYFVHLLFGQSFYLYGQMKAFISLCYGSYI